MRSKPAELITCQPSIQKAQKARAHEMSTSQTARAAQAIMQHEHDYNGDDGDVTNHDMQWMEGYQIRTHA